MRHWVSSFSTDYLAFLPVGSLHTQGRPEHHRHINCHFLSSDVDWRQCKLFLLRLFHGLTFTNVCTHVVCGKAAGLSLLLIRNWTASAHVPSCTSAALSPGISAPAGLTSCSNHLVTVTWTKSPATQYVFWSSSATIYCTFLLQTFAASSIVLVRRNIVDSSAAAAW